MKIKKKKAAGGNHRKFKLKKLTIDQLWPLRSDRNINQNNPTQYKA